MRPARESARYELEDAGVRVGLCARAWPDAARRTDVCYEHRCRARDLCGARCGDPGGEEAGESAGVAGAEAALRREYSVPPTAMAVPPPTGSVTRVTLNPDVERVGRDGAPV